MKAVVLEIKNGFAAVLSDDGRIVKIKNSSYEIGQQIQLNSSVIKFKKKITFLVSSAAAIMLISTGAWTYASPYTYVSLDVNPSIEFSVNRYDRVIHVNAVNDDGDAILHEISLDNLQNKTIITAVKETVNEISDAGYFNDDNTGGIVITTSGQNTKKSNKLAKDLEKAAKEEITKYPSSITVEALHVDSVLVKEAHKLGVTPGKLHLLKKLQASTSDPSNISIKDWINKSVKEIKKATKNNNKINASNNNSDDVTKEEVKKEDTNSLTSNIIKKESKQEKQILKQSAANSVPKKENNDKLIVPSDKNDKELKSINSKKNDKEKISKSKNDLSNHPKETDTTTKTTASPSHKEKHTTKDKIEISENQTTNENSKHPDKQNNIPDDTDVNDKNSPIGKQKSDQDNPKPDSQKTNQNDSKAEIQKIIPAPATDENSNQQMNINPNSDNSNAKFDNRSNNSNKETKASDQSNEPTSNNGGNQNNSSKRNLAK